MGGKRSDRFGIIVRSLFFPLMGAAALAIAPPDLLRGDPARLLMPFLGLFMAGILPAISLTINSIKAGGFSIQRIHDLTNELRRLLNYLQLLFVVALVAAVCLVMAETFDWGRGFYYASFSSRAFNLILGGCMGILIASLPKIRGAFAVLLDINRDIAIDEATNKLKSRAKDMSSIVDRFPTKEKFGELFGASEQKRVE